MASLQEQLDAIRKTDGEKTQAITRKDTEIAELKQKISVLSALPEPDHGAGAGLKQNTGAGAFNLDDDKQLGGMQGEMFALDRPYNMRARAALLACQGINIQVRAESSVDYSRLKEDLGAFYRIRWQDRLQSFLTKLPSIESIFPVESGYQDLATLVNIWLGEFSQADNTSSDFDNVTKGEYEFDNETLRMFSVMFAHKFRDLKQLEKTGSALSTRKDHRRSNGRSLNTFWRKQPRSCITSVNCAVSMACARILTLTSRDVPWKRPTVFMNG